jgi:hypothetical protein
MGRKEEAIAELLEADRLSAGRLITKVTVGYAYAVSGQRKKALAMLDYLL